jgi:hypothetical protein
VDPSGQLFADRDQQGQAETFRVFLGEAPATIAFRATSNNKLVCAESNGSVVCNRDARGAWESWNVQYHDPIVFVSPLPACCVPNQPGLCISLRTAHGKFVCAESDHRCVADRTALGAWEHLFMQTSGNMVSLRSAHGRYLGDSEAVAFNETGPKMFVSQHAAEHALVLKATRGKYVCAEPNNQIVCNRDAAGAWEQFHVEFHLCGRLAFKTHHNKFLCAENGNAHLVADRTAIGAWETFVPVAVAPNVYAFKAGSGGFVRVDGAGKIHADATEDRAEKFRIVLGNQPGTMALRATSNNKLVCAEDNNNAICNRDAVGAWESFIPVHV